MQKFNSSFTVFFDGQYWCGVYERTEDGGLTVCKITFGAEPKDGEVYDFLLKSWAGLRFGQAVQASGRQQAAANPKRMQRLIKKQLAARGVGTKAQQAMQLQQQAGKVARKQKSRAQKEAEQQRQFDLRQQKRKEKHKGH